MTGRGIGVVFRAVWDEITLAHNDAGEPARYLSCRTLVHLMVSDSEWTRFPTIWLVYTLNGEVSFDLQVCTRSDRLCTPTLTFRTDRNNKQGAESRTRTKPISPPRRRCCALSANARTPPPSRPLALRALLSHQLRPATLHDTCRAPRRQVRHSFSFLFPSSFSFYLSFISSSPFTCI